ncbi:hypothetical protein ACFQPA_10460 [Halomarina halobia]|uniref:Uncharacterized protein n=1 Tax=Halomarina halobia TaxID=3033386 RepID=A0ABD6ABE8_9EURY|nr:hypothetical protein [Halomarina sp. PSR21]
MDAVRERARPPTTSTRWARSGSAASSPTAGRSAIRCTGEDGRDQLAHIESKILSLRDRMYTARGRELAEERHAVVARFVERFEAEVAGER